MILCTRTRKINALLFPSCGGRGGSVLTFCPARKRKTLSVPAYTPYFSQPLPTIGCRSPGSRPIRATADGYSIAALTIKSLVGVFVFFYFATDATNGRRGGRRWQQKYGLQPAAPVRGRLPFVTAEDHRAAAGTVHPVHGAVLARLRPHPFDDRVQQAGMVADRSGVYETVPTTEIIHRGR